MNQKLKVLLVSPYHPQKVGGIGTWSKLVLDYCKERKDVEIVFLNTVNSLPKRQSQKNIIFHVLIGIVDSLWILLKLLRCLIANRPDIVHYTSSAAFALYKDYCASLLCRLFKTPMVIHWRFGRIPELCLAKNKEYHNLIRVIKSVSASIVIDKASFQSLNKEDLKNVYCLPNPISESLENISRNLSIGKIQQSRDFSEIVFVGHMLKTKGVTELVSVVSKIPEIKKLTLIGPFFDPSYEDEIKTIAIDRDNGQWLNLVGELKREEVFNYLQRCGTFCLPSYTEGFPNAVVEAMANACPIVSTKVGAIPEMLADNCGLCISPQNEDELFESLKWVITNHDASLKMANNARDKVLRLYTLDRVFFEYMTIWKTVKTNMGIIGSLYKRVCLISPKVEVTLRKVYWNNANWLGKFNPNKGCGTVDNTSTYHINFDKVLDWFRQNGVNKGDLLIVHSGYGELESTGLEPDEIIDKLLELIGPDGTLCMPVIRKFKGAPKGAELLTTDVTDLTCKYDALKTKVISGMLPFFLMQRPEAEISLHPLNPMCAIGPLAKQMMEHNLDGDYPSPHGKGSSWKFCLDHGAKICFIGTDLEHHNTMTHVAEEAFDNWHWTDDEWFQIRKFNITDKEGNTQYKEVYERKPKWGMLHYAEINVNHDLKNNIVKTDLIDGLIHVGYEDAQEFIAFLQSKNKKGYPYA